ncbi:MAG: RNHCP domain-containing protein [Alphaproteobacteria bacterium]
MTKNFTRKQEDFICELCGEHVHGNGYTNHCPRCLTSKHVDINPGDRACDCGGLMMAIGLDNKNGELVLVQRCEKCGFVRRNKISDDDNKDAIHAVMNGTLPEYIEMMLKNKK